MFFNKLNDMTEDEAIVKSILQLCNDSEPIKYYPNLVKDHNSICINERKVRMKDSTQTLTKRYTDLTNLEYSTTIYDSFINEELRIVLTRWRLSCTDLNIETGRYTGLNPEEILCSFCPDYVEDEHHAIFVCRAYLGLRIQFSELLRKNNSVKLILNPKNLETATEVGTYLHLIEEERKKLFKGNK